ncbi:hypothetical protein MGP2080_07362 [marine gamma proteobacterium HTCC2080]|nr:hypothetical protein MGP2080_07362 [marine gamma proteobacterium HTCC2080]
MTGLQSWITRYQVQQNPLKTERRIELAVLVLLVLLLVSAVLGGIRLVASNEPEPVFPSADSLAVQTLQLDRGLTAEQAVEILNRPLFWQSRRPLVPPPKTVAKPKPKAAKKLAGVTLLGVYGAGDGLGLIATVDGAFSRISKGQSVKGWKFSDYEEGTAVFVSGGKKSVLPLELTAPSVKIVSVPKADNSRSKESSEASGPDADDGGGLSFGGGHKKKSKKRS